MITLIHGDNIDDSRKAFLLLKEKLKTKETRELHGGSIDATQLRQALESSSLFSTDVSVVIENVFSKLGKKVKTLDILCEILSHADDNVDILLWEGKEIGLSVLKKLGKADIQIFKTPTVIFQFLDSLAPGRQKHAVMLYQKVEDTQPVQIIFAMLIRRIRQLLMVSSGVVPEGIASWQIGKLTHQAKLFSVEKLKELYSQLRIIEYGIKSGSSPFSLHSHIQQILLSL